MDNIIEVFQAETKEEGLEVVVLYFKFPDGRRASELAEAAKAELQQLIASGGLYGKTVRLLGRMTVGIVFICGHVLSHTCKEVEIFDPQENTYYSVVKH